MGGRAIRVSARRVRIAERQILTVPIDGQATPMASCISDGYAQLREGEGMKRLMFLLALTVAGSGAAQANSPSGAYEDSRG